MASKYGPENLLPALRVFVEARNRNHYGTNEFVPQ